jgi:hypothetical protein
VLGVHNATALKASGFEFAFDHDLRFFAVGVNLRCPNLKGKPQPNFLQMKL